MPCSRADQYPKKDPARYIGKECTNKYFRNINPSISRRKIAIGIRIEIESLFKRTRLERLKLGSNKKSKQ